MKRKAFFAMITLLSCLTIFCCISCVDEANPSETTDGVEPNVDPYNELAMDYWLKNAVDVEDTVVYEDINNVEVDLFFGAMYTRSFANHSKEHYKAPYSLVLYSENQTEITLRRFDDFFTEDYHCNVTQYADNIEKMAEKYTHSEKIVIPKELFNKDSGKIGIRLTSMLEIKGTQTETTLVSASIYYKLVDEGVELSRQDFNKEVSEGVVEVITPIKKEEVKK